MADRTFSGIPVLLSYARNFSLKNTIFG